MADEKHLMAVRLDRDEFDWLKQLAESETGGNTSLLLRKLLKEARTARESGSRSVSHVSRNDERQIKPAFREPSKMPDPSDKIAYARWLKNNR